MTTKSALELFREGLDYQQISISLKIPVPDVERRIHALRSAEKGDTSQQDYWLSYLQRWHRYAGKHPELIKYAGKERGVQF